MTSCLSCSKECDGLKLFYNYWFEVKSIVLPFCNKSCYDEHISPDLHMKIMNDMRMVLREAHKPLIDAEKTMRDQLSVLVKHDLLEEFVEEVKQDMQSKDSSDHFID